MEGIYDRINDYGSVNIRLASPEDVRKWSFGEVKRPETINYRSYRSEKDGLFCEKIFGPERDWECSCQRYKGIKYKGTKCERCGVEITNSRVRRKRMGHINLAAPVVHIWFFKAMPSRLGSLLNKRTSALERVIYFQDYIVIEPGDTSLKEKQLLTKEEYEEAVEAFGADAFEAGMGAEAVKKLLERLDLPELESDLRTQIKETGSKQKQKDLTKRLDTVCAIKESNNKPAWLVLDVIPVIPPDLRPLVPLEGGNFATSDLNDLYRRLINRNNRLKRLLDLNAPDVIICNEKRMLQQSVDALFDNNRCKRPVTQNNRPLKSLTDMIKGKQGRFRENLLGKRVDYSARSVIVVGPDLRLHQCGLPKKIALELFQPFIIRRLKEIGLADTIKSAKKMLERKEEEVWDILEEVIHEHPVLLNRAPTLHRMGIQAFEPILIEGNAIKLHPLVCTGFNADFDGDQMAVHLPLSLEAQTEATTLMLSTNNIFSPAHGSPIISPSQDIVLGCYWLTATVPDRLGEGTAFSGPSEVLLAYSDSKIHIHAAVRVRMKKSLLVRGDDKALPETPLNFLEGERSVRWKAFAKSGMKKGLLANDPDPIYETTAGRIVFNDILPEGMDYYNYTLTGKMVNQIIADCYQVLGVNATLVLLDDLKELGFKEATRAGISFAADDLVMPEAKFAVLEETQGKVDKIMRDYRRGVMTEGERYNQIIDQWTHATEQVGDHMLESLKNDHGPDGSRRLNPIYIMLASGARGSKQQIRQLAGMRGLMAKPSKTGAIIETPIKASFREGLMVLEYFSSTHGARKGLADTALKTADSGYLTRKLADVAQNVIVNEHDCGTTNGITKTTLFKGNRVEVPLPKILHGRTARTSIIDRMTGEVMIEENHLYTVDLARKVTKSLGSKAKVRVRSVLTCESPLGVCALCYGMDLSSGQLVELGTAVGIIAAQSIGEPGTQLTMRTFHIGGVATRDLAWIDTDVEGTVEYLDLHTVVNREGIRIALSEGQILVKNKKGKVVDSRSIPNGSEVKVTDGEMIKPKGKKKTVLGTWDPNNLLIRAEFPGTVTFEDFEEGKTFRKEKDAKTGVERAVVIEHKGDLHPQIVLKDSNFKPIAVYPIPEKAYVDVVNGQEVIAGDLLAQATKGKVGTQDITGGLPRVTEILEVRKPKDPATIAEIDGVVEIGEKRRGKRTIIVRHESGMEKEHQVAMGKHLIVHKGDRVKAGEPLVSGSLVPRDVLRISGEEKLHRYLLEEVQSVYRFQGVPINDKHIEIILAQMLRRLEVKDPGDTHFLPAAIVDKFRFREQNRVVQENGCKPATARPILLGITKASLYSESFISAASFQETTKVLTKAALAGRTDPLLGLKENVILGHMIPAGTGFKGYLNRRLKHMPTMADLEREKNNARAKSEAPKTA